MARGEAAEQENEEGETALMPAANGDHAAVVQMLSRGALVWYTSVGKRMPWGVGLS